MLRTSPNQPAAGRAREARERPAAPPPADYAAIGAQAADVEAQAQALLWAVSDAATTAARAALLERYHACRAQAARLYEAKRAAWAAQHAPSEGRY